MALSKPVVLAAYIVTTLGVHDSCPKHQFFNEAIGKCDDCSTAMVCHKSLTKCPGACLASFLENMQDRNEKLQRQQDAITGWEFNNSSIVLACFIAGGIFLYAVWQLIKNKSRIIQLIKGTPADPEADPEKGLTALEPLIGPPTVITPNITFCSQDTQTAVKTTEEKETQVDKIPIDKIGYQIEDEESDPHVQSPEPKPTSSEKITEEVDDNDKPKEGLEDQDLDHESETAVKTPFTD
ncbi:uncharacterized protein LOC135493958 [Lineus longissimus]|uniref:uncharacterized protein LOC135493958 n=1 Tax=Lineus longissimus TaxID=88925 RepID=UPI00315DF96E